MRVCVLTNFQKLPWGEKRKKALQKENYFHSIFTTNTSHTMDIFEGRLQSELIGKGGGELWICSPFIRGLREETGANASCNEWFGYFLSQRKAPPVSSCPCH